MMVLTLQRVSPSHQCPGWLTRCGIMTKRDRLRSATDRERMNLCDLLRRTDCSSSTHRMTLRRILRDVGTS